MKTPCLTIVVALAVGAVASAAQQFSTTRLEVTGPAWNGTTGALIGTREINPLVIATTAPSAQPIRFFTGDNGTMRAMEIGATGHVTMRGPLSIGAATTAAPGEVARIATIAPHGGSGLTIDLQGSVNATGLRLTGVGLTGTEEGGIVLSSQSNGTGTALRLGGPIGAMRPTFATGLDITGGVGFRYNALTAGDGTAITIGSSIAPRRGIEVVTSGSGHAGVISQANSSGTAIIGSSMSAAYQPPEPERGVGVLAIAASNSNARADTVTGVLARVMRGGNGGTRTTSIGIRARAQSTGVDHAGTAIGLHASADATSPGVNAAVAGVFDAPSGHLALAVSGGDVYLGSEPAERPSVLDRSTINTESMTTTHLYRTVQSGRHANVSVMDVPVAAGAINDLDVGAASMIRLQCPLGNTILTGVAGAERGRVLTIMNVGCPLTITNENINSVAAHRIRTSGLGDLAVPVDGVVTLWYDEEINRWRVASVSW